MTAAPPRGLLVLGRGATGPEKIVVTVEHRVHGARVWQWRRTALVIAGVDGGVEAEHLAQHLAAYLGLPFSADSDTL